MSEIASPAPVRELPSADPRVESGAVQFGDDWPGVFIRGDNAGYYAMSLAAVLDSEALADLSVISRATLVGVQRLLASGVVGPAASMVTLAELSFDGLPANGQYFRHAYGGLYRRKGELRASEDGLPRVHYEHLWPFERGDWTRPVAEWESRFTPITLSEVREAMKGDRTASQQAVNDAKAASKRKTGN